VELAFGPRRDMAASRIGLDRLSFGIVSTCGHLPWPASLPDRHEPQMTCQLAAICPLSAAHDLHPAQAPLSCRAVSTGLALCHIGNSVGWCRHGWHRRSLVALVVSDQVSRGGTHRSLTSIARLTDCGCALTGTARLSFVPVR
jgi:hypothetical protein